MMVFAFRPFMNEQARSADDACMLTITASVKRGLAMGVVLLLMAGCVGTSEPLDVLLWEGVLDPAPGAPVSYSGSVAMVANQHDTQIGVGVTGGASGAQLGWAVRTGTCTGTGQRVAAITAYPPIVISAEGSGNASATIRRRVDDDERYVAELFPNTNGSGAVLACGELIRRD
jgi:hypothetical protein